MDEFFDVEMRFSDREWSYDKTKQSWCQSE